MNKDFLYEKYPEFARRMSGLLEPDDYGNYLAALEQPAERIARVNPLKAADESLLLSELGGFPRIPESAKPGKSPLYSAGAYYVQEPAAAAVSALLSPLLPEKAKVLDMCAAPGGKVTAAAAARADCVFLANEIVFARAKILLSNVERTGLRNCTVTSLKPSDISRYGENLFDAVIADVPCSGEGMLRKTEFFSADLSTEAVAACALRAEKILDECDRCLRTGGILLFSTCTFNTLENEEQVRRLISRGYEPIEPAERPPRTRRGFGIEQAVRFFPQDGGGEGHFACLLRKTADNRAYPNIRSGGKNNAANMNIKPSGKNNGKADKKRVAAALDMCAQLTREKFDPARFAFASDGLEYLPDGYPFAPFPALRRGMRVADFIGDRPVPHHHFATAASSALTVCAPDYPPDSDEIAAYLHGAEFACEEKSGFRILKVASLGLGLIKIVDGIAKNKYPKGLRL